MTFTPQARCQTASGEEAAFCLSGSPSPTPALEQKRSMRPCRASISATMAATAAPSLTSRVTASPPISLATAAAPSPLRSATTTTAAPALAKARLSPAPMPSAPPVTTTTLSLISMS